MSTAVSRAIFAESGHFTAMHNALFDSVQPRLSLSAWSVLCVIVRRTRGWGKKYDAISYQQIMAATGIKSTATIAKALNELLSEIPFGKPLLRRQRSSERTASCREATRYALNPGFEILEDASQRPETREADFDCGAQQGVSREEEKEEAEGSAADSVRQVGEGAGFLSPASNSSASNSPALLRDAPLRDSSLRDSPFRERGVLESEGREGVRDLDFEAPTGCGALENEETKETPGCYEVENSECVRARPSDSSAVSSALMAAVCTATLRDPALVSARMRSQLEMCARRLERAGYGREEIERAAQRWPYPTAPTPAQLLDNIAALLGARPSHAKPSNPAAASAAPTAAAVAGAPFASTCGKPRGGSGQPRFEPSAQRKSRKWASWLAELGEEC